jgi:LL-diaminopimelate aminotransferase
VTPGTVFGGHGEGYFRISITAPIERLELAMGRLERWVKDGLTVSQCG